MRAECIGEKRELAGTRLSTLNYLLSTFLLLSAARLAGQENSSLSDSNLEAGEAGVTPETLLLQNDLLRKQLALDRETEKTLTESLVVSNSEAELFRRKYSELESRVEALGIESVSRDRAQLEQRLLKAVSDLQLTNRQKERYREQLAKVTETILRYVKTTQNADPEARADLEAQVRATSRLFAAENRLGENDGAPGLMDGRVLSVKEEWSLVVSDLGERQGAKIGMPLRVMRDGKTIATLCVVDVREKISGAVIQKLETNRKINVGDHLEVDARRDVSVR